MQRFEVKAAGLAVNDAGEITGLAAVFDTPDRGGDVIRAGAFKGATMPMPMLASHDPADVVGVWESATETPQGLAVKGRLLVNEVPRAAQVRALVMAGAMGGLSIGYTTQRKAARKGGGRDLLAVELLEISIVAIPMHPDAKITNVKAHAGGKAETMDQEAFEAALAEVEKKAAGAAEAAVAAAVAPYVQRVKELETKAARPVGGGDGSKEFTPERKAFAAYIRLGQHLPENEKKALTLSDAAVGQMLAPPELQAEILRDLVVYNPMRPLIDVKGISVNDIYYNKRVGRPVGGWTTENGIIAPTDFTFSQVGFKVHTYSTQVQISNVLSDDVPAAEAELREGISEDFGLSEGLAFLNGAGDAENQPEGLMVATGLKEHNNGHATELKPEALVKMIYRLDAPWRRNAVFLCNAQTLGVIRSMRETASGGQFLWQPSMQAGQPDRLLGYPIYEMPDMPAIAANAFPIIFGDMKGYRAVERMAMSFMIDPYTLAAERKTRIFATRRLGGKVLDKSRFVKLKMAA